MSALPSGLSGVWWLQVEYDVQGPSALSPSELLCLMLLASDPFVLSHNPVRESGAWGDVTSGMAVRFGDRGYVPALTSTPPGTF